MFVWVLGPPKSEVWAGDSQGLPAAFSACCKVKHLVLNHPCSLNSAVFMEVEGNVLSFGLQVSVQVVVND